MTLHSYLTGYSIQFLVVNGVMDGTMLLYKRCGYAYIMLWWGSLSPLSDSLALCCVAADCVMVMFVAAHKDTAWQWCVAACTWFYTVMIVYHSTIIMIVSVCCGSYLRVVKTHIYLLRRF